MEQTDRTAQALCMCMLIPSKHPTIVATVHALDALRVQATNCIICTVHGALAEQQEVLDSKHITVREHCAMH
jgi:hypothetical protein